LTAAWAVYPDGLRPAALAAANPAAVYPSRRGVETSYISCTVATP
jgi:hypothetical protein